MGTQRIRCFVAFDIEEPGIASRISMVQTEIRDAGIEAKLVDPRSLHLTLQFLGEITPEQVRKVSEAIASVEFRPFRVAIRGVGYFPGGQRINVVWIGVEDLEGGLSATQREVSSKLSRLGFRPDKEFSPHITILRVKYVRDRIKIMDVIRRLSGFEAGQVVMDSLKLKKSTLTPSGPIYEDLQIIRART